MDWYGFDGWSIRIKQLVCVYCLAMFLSYWLAYKFYSWIIIVNPSETLLVIVIQSMTGQEEAKLTISFDLADGNIGDIFMKLDGVSSGRAADCVL